MSSKPEDESRAWITRLLEAIQEGGLNEACKARCERERRRALAQLADSYRFERDPARSPASTDEGRELALARLGEWSV